MPKPATNKVTDSRTRGKPRLPFAMRHIMYAPKTATLTDA